MIQNIIMRGIKSMDGIQELTGRDIITGPNGAGKTTRAQALGIALLGYAPGGGKLPAETMKLARGDSMTVGVDTGALKVERQFTRKGAKTEQRITIRPPFADRTAAEKEKRIERELGKLPVMLDFNEFLGLSDMKRREFIYSLAGAGGDGGGGGDSKKQAAKALRKRLRPPGDAGPGHARALESDIAECLEQYVAGDSPQEGLQAMAGYAREQASFWRKERDKAVGASQKIAEYKNEIDATDRSLDANRALLESLRGRHSGAVADLALALAENRRREALNARIAELGKEIAQIEASGSQGGADGNQGDADGIRALIGQYTADLRDVDNRESIEMAKSFIAGKQAQALELEKTVGGHRDEYQAAKAKKDGNISLMAKLGAHSGRCPIDRRIVCSVNFSGLMDALEAENASLDADLAKICSDGKEARAELDAVRADIDSMQGNIDRLRAEEVAALRDNEAVRAIIREYEAEIAKIEGSGAEKERRLAGARGELAASAPGGGGEWGMLETAALEEAEAALKGEIAALMEKIDTQVKSRNALEALKSSMIDGERAGLHAENWKLIEAAVGPKGLQGELVKDALAPLAAGIQTKLLQMGIKKEFYFQTADAGGKEIFQFGWSGADSRRLNFDALSTGEQLLLLIALMTVIIERLDPPYKILCIDNAESLDRRNLLRVLNGLNVAGAGLDNIIFSGVIEIAPDDAPGWRVWELGGGAA